MTRAAGRWGCRAAGRCRSAAHTSACGGRPCRAQQPAEPCASDALWMWSWRWLRLRESWLAALADPQDQGIVGCGDQQQVFLEASALGLGEPIERWPRGYAVAALVADHSKQVQPTDSILDHRVGNPTAVQELVARNGRG